MANIATNLEQVLQSLGKLGLEELKIVEQQIVKAKAKNGKVSASATGSKARCASSIPFAKL